MYIFTSLLSLEHDPVLYKRTLSTYVPHQGPHWHGYAISVQGLATYVDQIIERSLGRARELVRCFK